MRLVFDLAVEVFSSVLPAQLAMDLAVYRFFSALVGVAYSVLLSVTWCNVFSVAWSNVLSVCRRSMVG